MDETPPKHCATITVKHRQDLAEKYLGKFVTPSDIDGNKEDWNLIGENDSVLLMHDDKCVGAIIRNIAKKDVADYYGHKLKLTVKAHPPLKRGRIHHADSGKLVGHGIHADRKKPSTTMNYVYKDKHLNPEEQKIYDEVGNSFGKWLYKNAQNYLSWTTKSYEEFKKKVSLSDDELIGAVFCAENYEAVGHRDNDRSEWAVGFCYDTIPIKKGYFIYPEYGIAINMTSNSLWCWKTQAVHGTARLDLNGGIRYTSAITLTEKTAKAMEREFERQKEQK